MFIFDASDIVSKRELINFIDEQKIFFKNNRDELFDKYEVLKAVPWTGIYEDILKYANFRDEYKNLVSKIVADVIKKYRYLLPKKCLIVEFGSFAKRTERIFSDFDITICYDEKKTDCLEVSEEIVNYTIVSIFGYSIDHIHGKFQHYPDIPEMYQYTEKDNHYRLTFKDGYIDYKCGPETLVENLIHIKNVRDYNSMLEGYREKYIYRCDIDCLYSINIIENTTAHNFINDLSELETKYDIFKDYQFDLETYSLNEVFSASELKVLYKKNGIVLFYIFICFLRKNIKFNNGYSFTISELWTNETLINFYGIDYVSQLQASFLKFMFYFNRLELTLVSRQIAFSSRCHKELTAQSIDLFLYEDWSNTTNINMILESRNQLIMLIKIGLNKLTKTNNDKTL